MNNTTHLRDSRKSNIKSMAEAAEAFNVIARTEIDMAKIQAQAEARIAKIKADTASKIQALETERKLLQLQEDLADFIDSHRELFEKPRKHKTSLGSFGLQKASGLNYTDTQAAIEFLVDQKMINCFKTTHKPEADGIKAALEAGTRIPGVTYQSGLIVKYVIDRALIKEAKAID